MRIKKYVAKSMREALLDIKKDLGENAVILKTRKMNASSFPFGGKDIEVTAAVEDEGSAPKVARPAFPEIPVAAPTASSGGTGVYKKPRTSCVVENAELVELRPWKPPVLSSVERKTPPMKTAEPVQNDTRYTELKEDIKRLTDMVDAVVKKGSAALEGDANNGWSVLYKKLVDAEVRPEVADDLMKNLRSGMVPVSAEGSVHDNRMVELLQKQFPVAGPIRCKNKGPAVIVFTGPTGSGKTTTLAKLVAHCRLNKSKKVSIITADTYRIAAIEQVRVFADIVKAELQVVFSPEEVAPALAACAGDDIVFVDTAGRSPHDEEHMEELKRYLGELHADEVHLVVSATTKDSDLRAIVARYREAGADRLLFTKLDETSTVGNIFNTVNTNAMPVSFFTFGQSVPDDIELASPAKFVRRLWEGTAA